LVRVFPVDDGENSNSGIFTADTDALNEFRGMLRCILTAHEEGCQNNLEVTLQFGLTCVIRLTLDVHECSIDGAFINPAELDRIGGCRPLGDLVIDCGFGDVLLVDLSIGLIEDAQMEVFNSVRERQIDMSRTRTSDFQALENNSASCIRNLQAPIVR
jgi:hypothetical protein